ncbi:MAG TPA: hypothetical protein VHG33_06805 [Woeseiaceae bacterium]|nr:hypothetical protein [Woeseiaceae bacterium]
MSRFAAFTLVLLVGSTAAVNADTLDMSAAEAEATFGQPGKPTRGMSQARVEANYGEPEARKSAVGDPPISRWDYENFVVYFEYDKVIHAVSRR